MSDMVIDDIKYIDVTPAMTSNTTPSPYVAFGTNIAKGAAYLLYDGSHKTFVRGSSGLLSTGLNFGEKVLINAYSISKCASNTSNLGETPSEWYFQGSNDNLSWTTIDHRSGYLLPQDNTLYTFTFDNEVGYKMYRIYVTATTQSGGNGNALISELRFYKKKTKHLLADKINQDSLETFDANGQDHVCYTNEGDIYVTDKDGRLVEMGRKTKARIEEVNDDLNDKFNTLNIAQKTVNDVGSVSLLESPVEFTITAGVSNGAKYTIINTDIDLLDDITNYDSLKMLLLPNNSSFSISDTVREFRVSNILCNESSDNATSLYIDSLLDTGYATGAQHIELICWFKDTKTLRVAKCCNSIEALTSVSITDIIGVKDRSVTIDPVEYVNTESGIEDTPVGHIIEYMGNTAPKHYLACDGSEYNITDYPFLAQHFKEQLGSYNCFGGDGTNTFAVPDHEIEYKSIVPVMSSNEQDGYVASASSTNTDYEAWKAFNKTINDYPDCWLTTSGEPTGWIQIELPNPLSVCAFSIASRNYKYRGDVVDFELLGSNDGENWDTLHSITEEPAWNAGETRTYYFNNKQSYLYYRLNVTKIRMVTSADTYISIGEFELFTACQIDCIKYEPTYFMKNTYNPDNAYSADEMIVGYWIDGKPIYRKVEIANVTDLKKDIDVSSLNIEKCISVKGCIINESSSYSLNKLPIDSFEYSISAYYATDVITIRVGSSCKNLLPMTAYVVLEYTKTTD